MVLIMIVMDSLMRKLVMLKTMIMMDSLMKISNRLVLGFEFNFLYS